MHQHILDVNLALSGLPGGGIEQPRQAWAVLDRVFELSEGKELRSLLTLAIARETQAVQRERQATYQSLQRIRQLWLGTTLLLLLLALALAAYFARSLRQPLGALQAGADALAAGDLTHRVPQDGEHEFARFARSVNRMADELILHRSREAQTRGALEAQVRERTQALQQALERLQDWQGRRHRLLADISHELRTPATVIRGEAEIALRGRPKTWDEQQATLGRIAAAAAQLSGVIEDLLNMARSDVDSWSIKLAPTDPWPLLQAALDHVRALAAQAGVGIDEPAPCETTASLLGDAQRLQQLMLLLLDNAVRYSRPQGRVRVEVTQQTHAHGTPHWCLRVIDHGIGIAPEDLSRVFERGFRSLAARRHCDAGSGLGLSIAWALARQHGGSLNLHSQPGEGTTATLCLPMLSQRA